jgi:hypothetical protein
MGRIWSRLRGGGFEAQHLCGATSVKAAAKFIACFIPKIELVLCRAEFSVALKSPASRGEVQAEARFTVTTRHTGAASLRARHPNLDGWNERLMTASRADGGKERLVTAALAAQYKSASFHSAGPGTA